LKSLEISAGDIVHDYLTELTKHFEEQLHELQVQSPQAMAAGLIYLPYHEVIKRSIIKSFDYYQYEGIAGSVTGAVSNPRMEAISVFLFELCSTRNECGINYSKYICQGFDSIFEILVELNKDVPAVNSLLARYLTRCIVDEIISPRYVAVVLERCDSAVDEEFVSCDTSDEDPSVQIAIYRNQTRKQMLDVMVQTKVYLSLDHYSTKLQHIWGIGT
jgi:hypothetical protein